MKILVTGGAGYIGSHTTQKLVAAGYKVHVFDNFSTGFMEAIPSGIEVIRGDVLDSGHLLKVLKELKITAVIHFAGRLIVSESVEKPLEYYEANTLGVLSLTTACVAAGVDKVIFSSTGAIYGNAGGGNLVNEDMEPKPLSPYAQSKLMAEQIFRDAEKAYGLKSVCLRYFNAAGAAVDGSNGQRTKEATHLLKIASEAACGKRKFVGICGNDYPTPDGTCVRDYIHIEDLSDLHILALKHLESGKASEVLNCGYGRGFSVEEVLNMMRKVSGVFFSIERLPRRAGDAASTIADNSKIKKLFGWQPRFDDLEFICRSAYEWECFVSRKY